MTGQSKKWWTIGGVGVAVALAGAYLARGTLFSHPDQADVMLSEIKEMSDEERFEQMRTMRERAESLPEEQREKLREGIGNMFRERIDSNVEEYENAATEEEKLAVLDRHLEEMQEWRQRMEAERERRRAEREAKGDGESDGNGGDRGEGGGPNGSPGARGGGEGGNSNAGGPPGGGRGRGAPSIEQRKKRMEGRNPDKEASRMRYFMKLRQRATEKGIDFGPRGGGPGGGRRRGGGGPPR